MKVKTFSFSKEEVKYLFPINAILQAVNTAIQVFIINNVYKRLGLTPDTIAQYDLNKEELYVREVEATDRPAQGSVGEPTVPEKPVDTVAVPEKPVEPPAQPKAE